MKNLFILVSIIIFSQSVFAQDFVGKNNKGDSGKDSACVGYRFYPGDTLFYRSVAYDSVVLDWDNALTKERFERLKIVCDSTSDSLFFLTITMTDFLSNEKMLKDKEPITRQSHPWVGRKIFIAIDSLGIRHYFDLDLDSSGSMSPGGAFSPLLLVPYGAGCKQVKESWMITDSLLLPENGYPIPLIRMSYFYQILENDKDTLGHNVTYFDYINTGQGNVNVQGNLVNIQVTSVLNGHGKVWMDNDFFIPVASYATIEQKLTIHHSEDEKQPGAHFIDVNYSLERFVPSKLRPGQSHNSEQE